MSRTKLDDLAAFAAVADERSFTRAAAKLGMSQTALSHAMSKLEQRLGVRLLARTTRSVSATKAGQRLLQKLRPALQDIDAELAALQELRDTPSGTIRISTPKLPAGAIIMPMLARFKETNPDVQVELTIDEALADIVESRFDAGIRLGEQVEQDMIAVRIGPDLAAAIVGSPDYFSTRPKPLTPHDLSDHDCINYRQGKSGGLYAWEFERERRELSVRVGGSFTTNNAELLLDGALKGLGLATVFEYQIVEHVAEGRLVRVLADWCPPFPGFFLYYPSRRQTPLALRAFIEAVRHRERPGP